ncbi:MAG: response regulator, partial [Polaromonas sp.]|nr:response regulator [Polaromonas sp.]
VVLPLAGKSAAAQFPGAGAGLGVGVGVGAGSGKGYGVGGAASASGADAPDATEPTLRILVVDDNHDAADSTAMLLEMLGYQVRTAYDGVSGVQAAAEFLPQVALLDIGMPDMNGYEAAQAIRHLPGGDRMRLVAVTGWGQPEDRVKSAEAGFDRHLVKPVHPPDLLALLEEWARAS